MTALQPAKLQPFYRGIAQYETKMGGKEKVAKYRKMVRTITYAALAIFCGGLLVSSAASLNIGSVTPVAVYGGGSFLVSAIGLISLHFSKSKTVKDYLIYVVMNEIASDYKSSKAFQILQYLGNKIEKEADVECLAMKQCREFCNVSEPDEFKRIIEALYLAAKKARLERLQTRQPLLV